jgi:hypothetical protein
MILSLFTTDPDFDAIAGDMSEEFEERVDRSGVRAAKLWYWRHLFRNVFALTAREVMRTPLKIGIIALGGVLGVNAVTVFYVLYAMRRPPLPLHADQWWTLLLIQSLVPFVLGWAGSSLIREREWGLALTYTAASAGFAGVGMVLIELWISPRGSIHIPESLRSLAIWGNVLRQGTFWLGCLAAILRRGYRGLSGNVKQFVAILPLAIGGASTLLGQTDVVPAKWIGKWALDVEKSTFEAPLLPGGTGPLRIVSQTLRIDETRIDEKERNISLSGDTVYSDNTGPHSSHDDTSLSFDGAPTLRGPISLTFKRINDSSFDIVSQLIIRGRNLGEVSHFVISLDGGTLTETKTQTEREGTDSNATRAIKTSTSVLVFRKLSEK